MEKPMIIQAQEVEKQLVEVVNNSNLPPFILIYIMEGIINQCREFENNMINEYQESLKQSEEQKDGDK